MKKLTGLLAGILLLTGLMEAAGEIGVDWGGNYGAESNYTGNLNQGLTTAVTSTGDYTFDSISDAAYRLPFGTVYGPSVDNRVNAPDGKTGKLYTGLQTVIHSSATTLTVAGIYRFSAATPLNQLQKTNPTNSVPGTMSLSVAYFVQKADFLNGLSSAAGISFSNAIGAASMDVLVRNVNAATIGFLVQEGTNWYATVAKPPADNVYGVLAINPYTENWYAFDPSANQFLNTNSPGMATSGSAFTNIQAFGIYGQHMNVNGVIANAEKFDVQGFAGSFTAILPPPPVYAVDFGASYSTNNINSTKTETLSNGDFDFDGTADDRVSSVTFGSVFTPPTSANWTTVPDKSNGTIYHGVSVAVLNNQAIDPALTIDRMGSNSRIQIGNTTISGQTLSLALALYWDAADFLNGGQAAPLANEAGSLSVSLASTGIKALVHFMVQAGGQWYISADSSGGSFSINGASAGWYAFDPDANALFWDEANPGSAVPGASLGSITAAGVYAQTDAGYAGETGSLFGMDGLQISVVAQTNDTVNYASWAAGYALTNGDESLTADPDGDLMNNLIEYGLGGNPTNSDAAVSSPVFSLNAGGTTNVLTYVYRRRLDAAARGLTYTVEKGGDLVVTNWSAEGITVTGTAVIDSEFEVVTNTVPAVQSKEFVRLQIGLVNQE